jgi:hypothetical protein
MTCCVGRAEPGAQLLSQGSTRDHWSGLGPVFLFLFPFFCVVKVYNTKVAGFTSALVAVKKSNLRPWMYIPTSCILKSASSYTIPVYSPGRRRKKKAIVIISDIAISSYERVSPNSWAMIKKKMVIGAGFMHFCGESSFLYALIWSWIRKDLPRSKCRGQDCGPGRMHPSATNACPWHWNTVLYIQI